MHHIPSLIQDLALILITAAAATLLFKKLKQPLVLGYLMAGVLISPNLPLTVSVPEDPPHNPPTLHLVHARLRK